jgi:hypothetical protein
VYVRLVIIAFGTYAIKELAACAKVEAKVEIMCCLRRQEVLVLNRIGDD